MRRAAIIGLVLFLAALARAGDPKATASPSEILYTLNWQELTRLAGLSKSTIEERGMGVYVYRRGRTSFSISQHTDLDSGRDTMPEKFVFQDQDGKDRTALLDLTHGARRETVEKFFQRFCRRLPASVARAEPGAKVP